MRFSWLAAVLEVLGARKVGARPIGAKLVVRLGNWIEIAKRPEGADWADFRQS